MITAGAIVVASFFIVSAAAQLQAAVKKKSAIRTVDDSISFWFKLGACILFGGNGLLWLLTVSNTLNCGAPEMERATSSVAILSTIAFITALVNFFLTSAMVNIAGSLVLLVAHWGFYDSICGSLFVVIGFIVLMLTLVRSLSLLLPNKPS